MALKVNPQKCPQNHKCPAIAECPQEAISQKDAHSLPVIDQELCIQCGNCQRFCPMGAFEEE